MIMAEPTAQPLLIVHMLCKLPTAGAPESATKPSLSFFSHKMSDMDLALDKPLPTTSPRAAGKKDHDHAVSFDDLSFFKSFSTIIDYLQRFRRCEKEVCKTGTAIATSSLQYFVWFCDRSG